MVQKSRKAAAFYRGDAGRDRADEELAKQKARAEARKEAGNAPFRFRVAVGGTTEFVILDDAPDFFRHEHNMKNPQTGFWDTFTGCTKEWDNCPVCEATGREPYYAMYLSVLDFTEFKTKDGTKHEFSRKLLVVKPAQQKKFIRAYNKAEKEGRTLRGAVFEVTRDGDKDSSIGNDIEFVEYMDEEELSGYVRSWKDKDGKKQTEDCSVPYDYEALFEEPDSDKLRALVGGEPSVGSREYERKAGTSRGGRGRGRDADDDDDAGDKRGSSRRGSSRSDDYEDANRSERMRSGSRSRRAESEDAEEAEEDSGNTRTRRSRRSAEPEDEAPPARGSRRSRAAEPEDDAPPARGSRRAAARDDDADDDAPPARGSRRARPSNDEAEDDDDAPPGAGRRLPMRGRR